MVVTAAIWPALDYSRVPYRLYHDAEIYAREQERIFRGPVWSFLGLDSEIPNPGDFRASYIGETCSSVYQPWHFPWTDQLNIEVQKCLTGQITADACCDNLIKGIADAKRKV